MRSGRLFAIVGVVVVGGLGGPVLGQVNLLNADPNSPTFSNPSFERPDTTFASPSAEKWTLSGPRQLVDIPGQQEPVEILAGVGVFENPVDDPLDPNDGYIAGAAGSQLGYIFANSINDAPTGVPMDHAFTQVIPSLTYAAGSQYRLAVGVASAQSPPPADSVFTLSLFAHDPLNVTPDFVLASEEVTVGEINGVGLTDFFATSGLISGDAIGKQVGIRIHTHTTPQAPSATGQFSFDNVRLTEVPEPASAALWAGAAGVAMLRRRRRH